MKKRYKIGKPRAIAPAIRAVLEANQRAEVAQAQLEMERAHHKATIEREANYARARVMNEMSQYYTREIGEWLVRELRVAALQQLIPPVSAELAGSINQINPMLEQLYYQKKMMLDVALSRHVQYGLRVEERPDIKTHEFRQDFTMRPWTFSMATLVPLRDLEMMKPRDRNNG